MSTWLAMARFSSPGREKSPAEEPVLTAQIQIAQPGSSSGVGRVALAVYEHDGITEPVTGVELPAKSGRAPREVLETPRPSSQRQFGRGGSRYELVLLDGIAGVGVLQVLPVIPEHRLA